MTAPKLVLLAGANGAGKSTLASKYVPDLIEDGSFLNADDVARALRPDNAEAAALKAGREMVRRRDELLGSRKSFCIETTLASLTLLDMVERANGAGYLTRRIFLFTPSPEVNEFRVKQRVMRGGHNISTNTIRRRHVRGLRYLPRYIQTCREAIVLDARTSSTHEVFRKEGGVLSTVDDSDMELLRRSVRAAGGEVSF